MTHFSCTPAEEIPETLAPTGALGLTSAQLQARLDEIHPVGAIDRTETEWFRTAVFYEVLVRSFKDSNGDGVGDFKGLTEKLDYLQWLGVDCLWLPPFYDSPLHDGGYDIRDYRWIREELGTIEDFKVFLDAAHDRGLRVIIDFVMNHTSDSHPWFQSSRADPDGPYGNYYVWSDTDEAYSDARIIFCDTEDSNWSSDCERKQFYWHRFFHHQPDLNFEEPRVMEEMFDAVRFWMDLGIDGFRLDAVPYLIEAEGTNCENLPGTHTILKQLRAMVDEEYPGRILLCEANQWPDDVVEYFGHDELTLEMVTEEERRYMWEEYAPESRWRCNLGIRRRLSPLVDNDDAKIRLLNAMLLSLPGSPVLYYGDEIGMGDDPWLPDRDGVRTPMQWDDSETAGFSTALPEDFHLPVIHTFGHDPEHVNVARQMDDPSSLLVWTRAMLGIRRHHPVFGTGEFTDLGGADMAVMSFLRHNEHETILCLANLSDTERTVTLHLPQFAGVTGSSLIHGQDAHPVKSDGTLSVPLWPYGYRWLQMSSEEKS